MTTRRVHHCGECNIADDRAGILFSPYHNIWRCEECINDDDELASTKWEHPREFEEFYRHQKAQNKYKKKSEKVKDQYKPLLEEFVASKANLLEIVESLSPFERWCIHDLAGSMGLKSNSNGPAKARRIVIAKQQKSD